MALAFQTLTFLRSMAEAIEAITPSQRSDLGGFGLVEDLGNAGKLRSFTFDLVGIQNLDGGSMRQCAEMVQQKLEIFVQVYYPQMEDHLLRDAMISTDLADIWDAMNAADWRTPGSTGFDSYATTWMQDGRGGIIVEHTFYTVLVKSEEV